jgi:alkylation response protein AidB-like acyl-CoA dehydrogenase
MEPLVRTLFSDEHDGFRRVFRSWLEREVVPHHEAREWAGIVPRERWLEAGKHGFLGLTVPEHDGGGRTDDYRFAAIEWTIGYTTERTAFGFPVAAFQTIYGGINEIMEELVGRSLVGG